MFKADANLLVKQFRSAAKDLDDQQYSWHAFAGLGVRPTKAAEQEAEKVEENQPSVNGTKNGMQHNKL
jgi:hypothetical protein